MGRKWQGISYANVVSTLALFVALGGTAVATGVLDGKKIRKGSITGKQIKAKSVPGGDLKPDTVRGRQVLESSLAKVPRSRAADTAGHATTADRAGAAETADMAQSLTPGLATRLTDTCPEGTAPYAGACIETSIHGNGTWPVAAKACGDAGGRLPHLSELEGFRQQPGINLVGAEHTDAYLDANGLDPGGDTTVGLWDGGTRAPGFAYGSSSGAYRCVFPASNR